MTVALINPCFFSIPSQILEKEEGGEKSRSKEKKAEIVVNQDPVTGNVEPGAVYINGENIFIYYDNYEGKAPAQRAEETKKSLEKALGIYEGEIPLKAFNAYRVWSFWWGDKRFVIGIISVITPDGKEITIAKRTGEDIERDIYRNWVATEYVPGDPSTKIPGESTEIRRKIVEAIKKGPEIPVLPDIGPPPTLAPFIKANYTEEQIIKELEEKKKEIEKFITEHHNLDWNEFEYIFNSYLKKVKILIYNHQNYEKTKELLQWLLDLISSRPAGNTDYLKFSIYLLLGEIHLFAIEENWESYIKKENIDQALKYFTEAEEILNKLYSPNEFINERLALKQNYAECYLGLARVSKEQGNFAEAKENAQKSLELTNELLQLAVEHRNKLYGLKEDVNTFLENNEFQINTTDDFNLIVQRAITHFIRAEVYETLARELPNSEEAFSYLQQAKAEYEKAQEKPVLTYPQGWDPSATYENEFPLWLDLAAIHLGIANVNARLAYILERQGREEKNLAKIEEAEKLYEETKKQLTIALNSATTKLERAKSRKRPRRIKDNEKLITKTAIVDAALTLKNIYQETNIVKRLEKAEALKRKLEALSIEHLSTFDVAQRDLFLDELTMIIAQTQKTTDEKQNKVKEEERIKGKLFTRVTPDFSVFSQSFQKSLGEVKVQLVFASTQKDNPSKISQAKEAINIIHNNASILFNEEELFNPQKAEVILSYLEAFSIIANSENEIAVKREYAQVLEAFYKYLTRGETPSQKLLQEITNPYLKEQANNLLTLYKNWPIFHGLDEPAKSRVVLGLVRALKLKASTAKTVAERTTLLAQAQDLIKTYFKTEEEIEKLVPEERFEVINIGELDESMQAFLAIEEGELLYQLANTKPNAAQKRDLLTQALGKFNAVLSAPYLSDLDNSTLSQLLFDVVEVYLSFAEAEGVSANKKEYVKTAISFLNSLLEKLGRKDLQIDLFSFDNPEKLTRWITALKELDLEDEWLNARKEILLAKTNLILAQSEREVAKKVPYINLAFELAKGVLDNFPNLDEASKAQVKSLQADAQSLWAKSKAATEEGTAQQIYEAILNEAGKALGLYQDEALRNPELSESTQVTRLVGEFEEKVFILQTEIKDPLEKALFAEALLKELSQHSALLEKAKTFDLSLSGRIELLKASLKFIAIQSPEKISLEEKQKLCQEEIITPINATLSQLPDDDAYHLLRARLLAVRAGAQLLRDEFNLAAKDLAEALKYLDQIGGDELYEAQLHLDSGRIFLGWINKKKVDLANVGMERKDSERILAWLHERVQKTSETASKTESNFIDYHAEIIKGDNFLFSAKDKEDLKKAKLYYLNALAIQLDKESIKSLEEAEKFLESFNPQEVFDPTPFLRLGQAYLKGGNFDGIRLPFSKKKSGREKARDLFEEVLKHPHATITSKLEAYKGIANAYIAEGKLKEAIKRYDKAVEELESALSEMAKEAAEEKKESLAKKQAELMAEIVLLKARTQWLKQNFDEALQSYRSIASTPELPDLEKNKVMQLIALEDEALALYRKGRLLEAEEKFKVLHHRLSEQSSVVKDLFNTEVLYKLAELYTSHGLPQEAKKIYEILVNIDPLNEYAKIKKTETTLPSESVGASYNSQTGSSLEMNMPLDEGGNWIFHYKYHLLTKEQMEIYPKYYNPFTTYTYWDANGNKHTYVIEPHDEEDHSFGLNVYPDSNKTWKLGTDLTINTNHEKISGYNFFLSKELNKSTLKFNSSYVDTYYQLANYRETLSWEIRNLLLDQSRWQIGVFGEIPGDSTVYKYLGLSTSENPFGIALPTFIKNINGQTPKVIAFGKISLLDRKMSNYLDLGNLTDNLYLSADVFGEYGWHFGEEGEELHGKPWSWGINTKVTKENFLGIPGLKLNGGVSYQTETEYLLPPGAEETDYSWQLWRLSGGLTLTREWGQLRFGIFKDWSDIESGDYLSNSRVPLGLELGFSTTAGNIAKGGEKLVNWIGKEIGIVKKEEKVPALPEKIIYPGKEEVPIQSPPEIGEGIGEEEVPAIKEEAPAPVDPLVAQVEELEKRVLQLHTPKKKPSSPEVKNVKNQITNFIENLPKEDKNLAARARLYAAKAGTYRLLGDAEYAEMYFKTARGFLSKSENQNLRDEAQLWVNLGVLALNELEIEKYQELIKNFPLLQIKENIKATVEEIVKSEAKKEPIEEKGLLPLLQEESPPSVAEKEAPPPQPAKEPEKTTNETTNEEDEPPKEATPPIAPEITEEEEFKVVTPIIGIEPSEHPNLEKFNLSVGAGLGPSGGGSFLGVSATDILPNLEKDHVNVGVDPFDGDVGLNFGGSYKWKKINVDGSFTLAGPLCQGSFNIRFLPLQDINLGKGYKLNINFGTDLLEITKELNSGKEFKASVGARLNVGWYSEIPGEYNQEFSLMYPYFPFILPFNYDSWRNSGQDITFEDSCSILYNPEMTQVVILENILGENDKSLLKKEIPELINTLKTKGINIGFEEKRIMWSKEKAYALKATLEKLNGLQKLNIKEIRIRDSWDDWLKSNLNFTICEVKEGNVLYIEDKFLKEAEDKKWLDSKGSKLLEKALTKGIANKNPKPEQKKEALDRQQILKEKRFITWEETLESFNFNQILSSYLQQTEFNYLKPKEPEIKQQQVEYLMVTPETKKNGSSETEKTVIVFQLKDSKLLTRVEIRDKENKIVKKRTLTELAPTLAKSQVFPKYEAYKEQLENIFVDINAENLIFKPFITMKEIRELLPEEAAPKELIDILQNAYSTNQADHALYDNIYRLAIIAQAKFKQVEKKRSSEAK